MTTEQLRALPSYNKLQSNGMTDQNIREFYSLPNGQRAAFLRSFQHTPTQPTVITPKVAIASVSTQKCTSTSVGLIKRMAKEYMLKDIVVNGVAYNMNKLGWELSFNTNRTRFGVCGKKIRRNFSTNEYFMTEKRIELSEWLMVNSDAPYEKWVDTILHEIAHAIDSEINSDCQSSHGYKWVRIAKAIGCNGERCGTAKVDVTASKYTLTCISCGTKKASHKKKKRVSACGACCNKHNGGVYSLDYKLVQTQNY